MNSMMVKIKSWRVCAKLDNDKKLFDILTTWMVDYQDFSNEEIVENIKKYVDCNLNKSNNDEHQRLRVKIEHYFL